MVDARLLAFTLYDVSISELEPDLIEIDYGTQIITPDLLRAVIAKVHKEWPGRKVAILVKGPAASDLGRVVKVLEPVELGETTAGVAVLTSSKLARMLGNLFMQIERSPYPNQLFNDEDAARVWLRACLQAKG